MKKIILLMLFSRCVFANDLIFLNSFENNRLVSGNVNGIESAGLQLQLSSSGLNETMDINISGRIIFSTQIPVGEPWNVLIISLPNNPHHQDCEITNNSGTMLGTGVNNLNIECSNPNFIWDQMNWSEGNWQ